MLPSQQALNFRDIRLEGQGHQVTIHQSFHGALGDVKTRTFRSASPYRGLEAFDEVHSHLFFGRDALVAELLRSIKTHGLVMVAGASGSGKSSLVRAGLLPQLRQRVQGFRAFKMKPGSDPFARLKHCLIDGGLEEREVELITATGPEALSQLSLLRPEGESWLLLIDQFEELFTLCERSERREGFIASLLHVLAQKEEAFSIVLTMRLDFFDRFDTYPQLLQWVRDGLQFVTSPHSDELRQCIEEPAAQHGVAFEEGLVQEILSELRGQPGMLPLLQYTLNQLWLRDNPADDRTLNKDSYKALGGVQGALRQRADAVYARKKRNLRDGTEQQAMRRVFLRLIDVAGSGSSSPIVSRRRRMSSFNATEQGIVRELVDEKLLVSSVEGDALEQGSTERASVELAHEALLFAWPQLKGWIEQAREVLYIRNRLSGDASHFAEVKAHAPTNADDELWGGTRLQQALDLRDRGDFMAVVGGLSGEEELFLEASLRLRESRAEAERLRAREAVEAAEWNRQLLLDSYVDRGHQLLYDKEAPFSAVLWLHRAYEQGSQNAMLPHLIKSAMQYVDATKSVLSGHKAPIRSARYSQDGRRIVTACEDHTARIWDSETGHLLRELRGHEKHVTSARFSFGGQRILTTSMDHTARLWDTESGALLAVLVGHQAPVLDALFSSDHQRIVTYEYNDISNHDTRIMIWDTTGLLLKEIIVCRSSVLLARFSLDGLRIVTVSTDGTVRILHKEDGRILSEFLTAESYIANASYCPNSHRIITVFDTMAGKARIWNLDDAQIALEVSPLGVGFVNARFSPDGSKFVTASESGHAFLWDAWEPGNGQPLATLEGYDARFSRNGERIITSISGSNVAIWNTESGLLMNVLTGHGDRVLHTAFSPDGQRVVTASLDRTARVYEVEEEEAPVAVLVSPNGRIRRAVYCPDGRLIVTTGDDNVARLWDAKSGEQVADFHSNKSDIMSAIFSPDCPQQIITGGRDNTVSFWDSKTGKLLHEFVGHGGSPVQMELSPDGRRTVTIGQDGTLRVWDVSSGRLLAKLTEAQARARSATFSPDGQCILIARAKGSALIWSIDGKRPLAELNGHRGSITGAQFRRDGQRIVTASLDGTARIWQAEGGLLLAEITGHHRGVWAATFSADGRRILTGDNARAQIWDADGGRLLGGITGQSGTVEAATFSPDNEHILTIGRGNTAQIWNVSPETRSPEELARVIRSRSPVRFEPEDGNVIVPCVPPSADC